LPEHVVLPGGGPRKLLATSNIKKQTLSILVKAMVPSQQREKGKGLRFS